MNAAQGLARQVGVAPACRALGVARATFYRRARPTIGQPQPRKTPARALSPLERERVRAVLYEPRFADRSPGEVGQLLRREGLYSSHLTAWRKARHDGALRGLASKRRGAKPKARNPLEPKVRELESKVARLEKELHKAHTILDVQEKVAGLLGFDLESGKNS